MSIGLGSWPTSHFFHCDNMNVMVGSKSWYIKLPKLMKHFRTMQFLTTTMDFEMKIVHIPGKINELADLISRDRLNVAQGKGY